MDDTVPLKQIFNYFYFAQVSHHPPISAFYTTNRQDGFTIAGTILAKSKANINTIFFYKSLIRIF